MLEYYEEFYEEVSPEAQRFYEEKQYNEIIKNIQNIDSQSFDWTHQDDIMFSFLFDTSDELVGIDGEIDIRYEDKIIRIFEMHGQGCYRAMRIEDSSDYYIPYEDLIEFHETGVKPMKYLTIDVVKRALNTLSCALESDTLTINGQETSIQEVMYYITENLG